MHSTTTENMTLQDDSDQESDLSDKVEILRETHMGQEVLLISDGEDEDETQPKPTKQTSIPKEPFRLLDLPAELRVHIYSFVLPHNMIISFERHGWGNDRDGQPHWLVLGRPRGSTDASTMEIGRPFNLGIRAFRPKYRDVETQLFLVSKIISNEARAVLYGSNTFKFTVDGNSHFPSASLRSPLIFGPLGNHIRLHLLRNLRSVHIAVLLNCHSPWVVKRQRSRLEFFVEILKEHADDENKKSLLQELKVDFKLAVLPTRGIYFQVTRPLQDAEKYMFGLESLSSLRNIKDVEITGLPDWYNNCLQLCIQGKGGDVQDTNWPLAKGKRRQASWSRGTKKGWVTTRRWYQPTLNWKEYAERNGIPIPEDIDKFWVDEY